jgi:hypothetical protein
VAAEQKLEKKKNNEIKKIYMEKCKCYNCLLQFIAAPHKKSKEQSEAFNVLFQA